MRIDINYFLLNYIFLQAALKLFKEGLRYKNVCLKEFSILSTLIGSNFEKIDNFCKHIGKN